MDKVESNLYFFIARPATDPPDLDNVTQRAQGINRVFGTLAEQTAANWPRAELSVVLRTFFFSLRLLGQDLTDVTACCEDRK